MALELGVAFEGLNDMVNAFTNMPVELDQAEKTTVRRGSLEALRIFRAKVSGPVLHVRTAAYRDSTTAAEPVRDADGWGAAVGVKKGAAEKYAAVHEGDASGGPITITAKKKLLAIPVEDNLTRAGVTRTPSPLDFPDGFWIPSRTPGLFWFVEPEGKGRLKVLFMGVRSVTIPARRPLYNTKVEVRPIVMTIAADEIEQAKRRAGLK